MDEILDLIESVSEGFPTYFSTLLQKERIALKRTKPTCYYLLSVESNL